MSSVGWVLVFVISSISVEINRCAAVQHLLPAGSGGEFSTQMAAKDPQIRANGVRV
jgi:hypothetical protein